MDPPRWIGRLDEAPARLDGPLVWIARHADAHAWPLPPPEPADLADAASARREGGGGRVLRRRLLRALAARVFDRHPCAIRFTRDARGAPGVEDLPAFVSAAGCTADGEAWSAVALAPGPVGVDLEAGPPTDALARWTLTEAYLKALGQGLTIAPEQVALQPPTPAALSWRLTTPGAPPADADLHLATTFTAAVAVLER